MTARAGLLANTRVTAIFAHPDDESLACGGTLARAAEAGATVTLVSATRGEARTMADMPGAGPDERGARREAELEAAAGVLGAAHAVALRYPDGMLPWVDAGQLDVDLRDIIVRSKADGVVTFGADGLYWHPDHIAVHERVSAVVRAMGDQAPALYYVTLPPGMMRAIAAANLARLGDRAATKAFDIAPDAFGAAAERATLILDVHAQAVTKLRALRCHRSQVGPDNILGQLDEADAAVLLGIEHFHRPPGHAPADGPLERLHAGA